MQQSDIRFRAWNIAAKEWQTDYVGITTKGELLGERTDGEYLTTPGAEVVLMQFTGLRDKNGKHEIYEGDLMQLAPNGTEPRHIYEVRWNKENSGFWVGTFYPLNKAMSEDYVVIGNIYENPNLLSNPQ